MFTVVIILSAVLALVFLVAATRKLRGGEEIIAEAGHLGVPWRFYRPLGLLELAAAAGLLIGLWWAPVGAAAAIGVILLMVGATTVRLRVPSTIALRLFPVFVGVLSATTLALRILTA